MALRLLLYISRVLEKKIDNKTIYSRKTISIPRPEFFVLYNGKESFPENAIYRLSDLYTNPKTLIKSENLHPFLELEVKVLNINEGKNREIVDRCKKLSEYCTFISKIHEFWNELGSLEKGIEKAIKYCSGHGILNQFLEIHGSEVLNMLYAEWNLEDAIAFAREEGREEAWEESKNLEKQTIAQNLLAEGSTPEFVQKITGLDLETIRGLNN